MGEIEKERQKKGGKEEGKRETRRRDGRESIRGKRQREGDDKREIQSGEIEWRDRLERQR
jgi:hypothetical protein